MNAQDSLISCSYIDYIDGKMQLFFTCTYVLVELGLSSPWRRFQSFLKIEPITAIDLIISHDNLEWRRAEFKILFSEVKWSVVYAGSGFLVGSSHLKSNIMRSWVIY